MTHKLKNVPARDLPPNTSPLGTLQNFLQGTRWTGDDLKRLGLFE